MKVLMSVVLMLLVSVNADATTRSCIEKLTNNYEMDSYAFTLSISQLDERYQRDLGNDHLAQAVLMIRALLDTKGCDARPGGDINFRKIPLNRHANSGCVYTVPELPISLTCFVEANLGKFQVSWDDLDHSFVIFSRWD